MKKYLRLITIYRITARYRLHELLEELGYTSSLSLLLKLPFMADRKALNLNRGQRLRLALEELGPIFIKFGQLLSTRRDMIPSDIADELAYLQDQVPPFPGPEAQALIEKALGKPVTELFAEFDVQPLASASIAQVHSATLISGEDVVVKVIRPEISLTISQDIALLQSMATLLETYIPVGKRLRPKEIIEDYKHVIFNELNLLAEGANTTQLRRNFKSSTQLYVPKVYWDYCRENVLVMEKIYGIPVGQIEELKAANINMKKLAETGVEVFFTQVFNHSFFHADMHPGNIFVSPENPQNPQFIALDCAIIGTLSKQDQQYLARNLLAIFKRDYRKVAELHVECGWVPADTPVNAFEATMRSVCEPIFEKPLQDISFGMLLLQLFRTAARFNMEIQPTLVLLQKTLINVEGLGKQLYPQLDLWQTALPFLEDWQKRRLSPLNNLKSIQSKLPEWSEQLPEIPDLLFNALSSASSPHKNIQTLLTQYEINRKQEAQERSKKLFRLSILAFILALITSQTSMSSWLADWPLTSVILLVSAFALLCLRK